MGAAGQRQGEAGVTAAGRSRGPEGGAPSHCWCACVPQRGTYLPQTYIVQEEMMVTGRVRNMRQLGPFIHRLCYGKDTYRLRRRSQRRRECTPPSRVFGPPRGAYVVAPKTRREIRRDESQIRTSQQHLGQFQ